jgi:phage-related protein
MDWEILYYSKEGIGRAFFCTMVEHKIIVLHACIKKSQKTPERELEGARQRLVEVQRQGRR